MHFSKLLTQGSLVERTRESTWVGATVTNSSELLIPKTMPKKEFSLPLSDRLHEFERRFEDWETRQAARHCDLEARTAKLSEGIDSHLRQAVQKSKSQFLEIRRSLEGHMERALQNLPTGTDREEQAISEEKYDSKIQNVRFYYQNEEEKTKNDLIEVQKDMKRLVEGLRTSLTHEKVAVVFAFEKKGRSATAALAALKKEVGNIQRTRGLNKDLAKSTIASILKRFEVELKEARRSRQRTAEEIQMSLWRLEAKTDLLLEHQPEHPPAD